MPIVKIQAPDGKVLTMEVPDGASQEDILAAATELYQPQYGVGETIARGLERGVTSTIRGAARRGG